MPRQVDFGPLYGVINFPDGATDQDVVDAYDRLEQERATSLKAATMQAKSAADVAQEQNVGRVPESIALGAERGLYSAPVAMGEILSTAGKFLPERPVEEPPAGIMGMPIPGFNRQFVQDLGQALADFGRGKQQRSADVAEAIGGGVPAAIAGSLAETAVTSAETLPFATAGLPAAALAAGAQQYGLTKSQFRSQIMERNPDLSFDEADALAEKPSVISGVMTAALTRMFGGTEKFINNIIEGRLKIEGIKKLLSEAARSAYLEFGEETLDQAAQGFAEKAYVNPEKTIGEIWNEAVLAGGAGALLGAGTPMTIGGVSLSGEKISERITRPMRLRQNAENRRAAIRRAVESGELLPERQNEKANQGQGQGQEELLSQPVQQPASAQTVPVAEAAAPQVSPQYETQKPQPTSETTGGTPNQPATANVVAGSVETATTQQAPAAGVQPIAGPVNAASSSEPNGLPARTSDINKVTDIINSVFDEFGPDKIGDELSNRLNKPSFDFKRGSPSAITVRMALEDISKNSPYYGQMASALLNLADEQSLEVPIRRNDGARNSSYSLANDDIVISQLGEKNVSSGLVLHEILHALTSRKIHPLIRDPQFTALRGQMYRQMIDTIIDTYEYGSEHASDAMIDLLRLYRKAVDFRANETQSNRTSKLIGDPQAVLFDAGDFYGLGNIHEFIAEAFSNRSFQKWLDSIPGEHRKKSIWKGIVDFVRKILSLPSGAESFLQQVLEAGGKLASQKRGQSGTWAGEAYSIGSPSETPAVFRNRTQVEAAKSNPGLSAQQQQSAEDLARVQASMSPDSTVGWIMASPVDEADRIAKETLEYIEKRRYLTPAQTLNLVAMPNSTEDEKRARLVAGATILAHYGIDRAVARQALADIDEVQAKMPSVAAKMQKLSSAQIKANVLEALFNRLLTDYRKYAADRSAMAPAADNLEAEYREKLAQAERRLNTYEKAPTAIQRALSAIAVTIPRSLLVGASNQAVINWVVANGALNTIVSDDVIHWLTVDDGSGSPALLGYKRLVNDLGTLRDVLDEKFDTANEIQQFEKWFRKSGKAVTVSARDFANAYFKFRTGRDKALKIAGLLEKQIEDLDNKIRAAMLVRDRLGEMMTSPAYRETVLEASRAADIAVRAVADSSQVKTGIVERDKTLGRWRIAGPISGEEYIVDLYPTAVQEKNNRAQLGAVVVEARTFAANNASENPLLADEYSRLADYIERYLIDPSFDPTHGFTMDSMFRVPGTSVHVSVDPFEWFNSVPMFKTIRDILERIGGRSMRQIWLDANQLDVTMRKVAALIADPEIGSTAQDTSVLEAIKSHGWTPEMFSRWNMSVAEKILASHQNNLGPGYDVGDIIVGSGTSVTQQDIDALRIMKRFEDAVLAAAPSHVKDRVGDLIVTRRAAGSGRYTSARVAAPWTMNLMQDWLDARSEADKIKLLGRPEYFELVVMGYMGEFNPEFQRANPAARQKAPLFKIYRELANTEKLGVRTFSNLDEVLDFIATGMVQAGLSVDHAAAVQTARGTLLSEIDSFIKAFDSNVLNYKSTEAFGDVPKAVISAATANNSFTTPRGLLQAPSTFYTYSKLSEAGRMRWLGGLRSLLNLTVLQSYREALAAMEKSESEMEVRIQQLQRTGLTRQKAKKRVVIETEADRKANKIRYDYLNLVSAIKQLRQAFGALEQFEASTTDSYEHPGIQAFQNVTGAGKAFLLSMPQPVSTNFWSATLLGPAIFHWQTGQYLRSLVDILPMPVGMGVNVVRSAIGKLSGTPVVPYQSGLVAELLVKKMSNMVESNPHLSKLLYLHAPLWTELAQAVIDASTDYRRIRQIAHASGIVTPYNLREVWKNQSQLKSTAGKLLEGDDLNKMGGLTAAVNYAMSSPGVRHIVEFTKATFPRVFDNVANYGLIMSLEHDLDAIKTLGWIAFQNRERQAAQTGADWRDVSQQQNVLTPAELGLGSHKALARMRDMFVGIGSLDRVVLDYYDRTKNMTPQQREAEPLINDPNDLAQVGVIYAAVTNLATETSRPHWTRGKGSTGFIKSVIGTFMGWASNMTKQFGKALQTHSADPQFARIATNMATLGTMVVLLAAVGAWNWEFGDELSKATFNTSSARIQVGNIHDPQTALAYFAQALVNVVPIWGSTIGSMAGVAFTGRGNPFDLSSSMFQLNLLSDTYKTVKRMIQTGDVVLPWADYARRWMGVLPKAVLNRVPILRGLVDQSNAIRSLNASAPPGTEIKWGQGGGGDIRYSPANDEIQKLIASAYEAVAHGGSMDDVRARYSDAIHAMMQNGKSEADAAKTVATALAAKEPIRVLTGREFTVEEERKWTSRMTPSQRADYQRAVDAWAVLSAVTGKDLGMTTKPSAGTAGGGGGVGPSRAVRKIPAVAVPVIGGGGGGASLGGSAFATAMRYVGRRRRNGTSRRRKAKVYGSARVRHKTPSLRKRSRRFGIR